MVGLLSQMSQLSPRRTIWRMSHEAAINNTYKGQIEQQINQYSKHSLL
jgi:hypothetical protein